MYGLVLIVKQAINRAPAHNARIILHNAISVPAGHVLGSRTVNSAPHSPGAYGKAHVISVLLGVWGRAVVARLRSAEHHPMEEHVALMNKQ